MLQLASDGEKQHLQAMSTEEGCALDEHMLEMRNVTKQYPVPFLGTARYSKKRGSLSEIGLTGSKRHAKKTVLDGVNLVLDAGDRLALVGASAAGKSTLVKMLFGMERPSSGEILYAGIKMSRAPKDEALARIRKEARLILQDPRSSFDPKATLFASVAEPLVALARRGSGKGDISREAVEQVFVKVGLHPSLQDYYPHQLSGGQLQRAAIARAIISEPKLVVADEMLSALDPFRRKEISDLFLHTFAEKSLIFIAHDLSTIRYLCSKIAVLHNGKIVDYGPLAEVIDDPKDSYTKDLIRADAVFGLQ